MSTLNVGKLNCTGTGVKLPSKTSGTLPTGETGLLIYNTSTSLAQIYNGTAWTSVGGGVSGGSNTQVQYNSNGAFGGSANLTFDGTNLTCGGNITANSDEKLKTNIQTIDSALDKVISMRGVEYDRIDMQNEHQIGVIAQEIEKIVPEVVYENDGIKSVAYGNLVALLIEAIKELKAEVDHLKGG